MALDKSAFDPDSCLIPEEWRSRLCPTHLAVLTHIIAPHRLSITIDRLWDAVMGPDEHPPSSQKLLNILSIFPSSVPILIVAQGDTNAQRL